MGKRGPAKKPTAQKIAEGNPGKKPLPKNEPKPELGIPEMPTHFTGEAKKEWDRVTVALAKTKVLSKDEWAAVANYCEIWERHWKCVDIYNAEGITVTSDRGDIKIHPAVTQASKDELAMLRFLCQFGLTPASRADVEAGAGLTEVEKNRAKLEEFLGGKKK